MATRKKISAYQVKTNLLVSAMGALMVLYILLLLLGYFNVTNSSGSLSGAIRLSLLTAVAAIGGTYLYLRLPQKTVTAKAPSTVDKSAYAAIKKDTESWISQLAEALKTRTPLGNMDIPAEVEGLKNYNKLTGAFKSLLAEINALENDQQKSMDIISQKDLQIRRLEESVADKEASIKKGKTETEAALQDIAHFKQMLARVQQELSAQVTEVENQKKEAVSKVERYRNISKFLEQAKSTLYSQHGTGKEYLVQLKLGLLADDAINLSNKNDYFSLNYELFRNGRPFAQLLTEQPPTHIDAYPESVKKLRQWIKAAGLENENWDLFYQNYPVTERAVS